MMTTEETDIAIHRRKIHQKIRHILQIYPVISPSMLQAGLGPQITANIWRPILEKMIKDKLIQQNSITLKSPAGRTITYTQLSLM